jgi:hypothetical protein
MLILQTIDNELIIYGEIFFFLSFQQHIMSDITTGAFSPILGRHVTG